MKSFRIGVHSHRNRLLLSMISLVFLTALAACLIAFGLVRGRLKQQRELQLEIAKSAVSSLLFAEQNRINNQLVLLSERPTLQNLLQTEQSAELDLYIQDFRDQSGLDFLAVYRADGTLLASNGRLNSEKPFTEQGFLLLDDYPLLAAKQIIRVSGSDVPLGTAVAGVWFERPFLDTLATDTGTQLKFYPPNETVTINAVPLSLTNSTGQVTFIVEITLPTAEGGATQNLLWQLGISTAVLTLLGALVSLLLVRRQTASLQKLTTSAQKITQGNTTAPLPLITAPTEMRHLATALHRLQAQHILSQQQLESKPGKDPTGLTALEESFLTAPGLIFDRSRLEVQLDQQESIRLTPLEARLLDILMRHSGQVLSSDALITAVWGNDGGDRTMLKQLIYRLRSKIDPENNGISHIETIPGIGYTFKN
jgi:HAMP domain-containing protein